MIELRKLKRAGGEETPRFEAVLAFNGREVAHVSNGGTGGATRFDWINPREDLTLLFTWAVAEARRRQPDLFNGPEHAAAAIDYLVMDEVEIAPVAKRLARQFRTHLCVRFYGQGEGRYHAIPFQYLEPDVSVRAPAEMVRSPSDPRVACHLNALSPHDAALRLRTEEPKEKSR